MKIKHIRVLLMLAAMIISCSNMVNAQSLKDLLGKLGGSGDTSETIGNLLEGILQLQPVGAGSQGKLACHRSGCSVSGRQLPQTGRRQGCRSGNRDQAETVLSEIRAHRSHSHHRQFRKVPAENQEADSERHCDTRFGERNFRIQIQCGRKDFARQGENICAKDFKHHGCDVRCHKTHGYH